MPNKLLIFFICLVLLLTLAVACGKKGDQGDDDSADDDAADLDCASAYHYLYDECGITRSDDSGKEIPVDLLISWCESNEAQYAAYHKEIFNCIRDHYGKCDDIQTCFDNHVK